ncbi:hypothetical protein IFT48_04280 [Pseudomonas fluorescens]|uniref:hypothetical protein n=1 Tax=Pseudomonas TaxID=286 RepID=UPI000F0215DC|nr:MULTISPECIES: hypothetical protein [Pseudomonas]MBD8089189.1 hypothetical protein [Pseudomonas fluorescens]MBD8615384.1 hypothetical protein [Pseudomonas putida]MBD8681962.1 hypothetical protein [Pseudomonas sp. CFBP 13719]
MKYEDLPVDACFEIGIEQRNQASYGYLSKPLIDSLADLFAGKRVVEAYAGRGILASILAERGVNIHATSLRMGHDCSESMGHLCDVENCSVLDAVIRYGHEMDYLLVCWPLADETLWRTLAYLPEHVRIVFIGEITDYLSKPIFLGGCASDRFFDSVVDCEDLTATLRYPTPRHDKIKVYRAIPGLSLV